MKCVTINERPLYQYIVEKWKTQEPLTIQDMLITLVEIRRYIEENKPNDGNYKIAKFYCDWALHSHLKSNCFAQEALKLFNANFRNPNLPYDNWDDYQQTFVNAIKYGMAGDQIGRAITDITHSEYTIDNQFMQTMMSCLIGIPFVYSSKPSDVEQMRNIDEVLKKEQQRWVNRCPAAVLTNMLTNSNLNRKIKNFVITKVIGARIDFNIMYDGVIGRGYVYIGRNR